MKEAAKKLEFLYYSTDGEFPVICPFASDHYHSNYCVLSCNLLYVKDEVPYKDGKKVFMYGCKLMEQECNEYDEHLYRIYPASKEQQ